MNVHHLDGARWTDLGARPAPDAKHEISDKLTITIFVKNMVMTERSAGSTSLTKVIMNFRPFRAKGTCTTAYFSMRKQSSTHLSLLEECTRTCCCFNIKVCHAELYARIL